MSYLIVIEAEGAGDAYFYEPHRVAATLDEAKELMREYMDPDAQEEFDALPAKYFVVFKEVDERFTEPHYFDPETQEEIDATEWLQQTGRI